MTMGAARSIVIAWLAFTGILLAGGLLFPDSAELKIAFQVVAFIVGFTLLNVVDSGDRRHHSDR